MELERQVFLGDPILVRDGHESLDEVFQLPDVAGALPVVSKSVEPPVFDKRIDIVLGQVVAPGAVEVIGKTIKEPRFVCGKCFFLPLFSKGELENANF